MAKVEEIVLDVKFNGGDAERNVAELTLKMQNLRAEQAKNKKAMKETGESAQEAADAYVRNTRAIAETQEKLRAANEVLKDSVKQNNANSGSLNEMRVHLKKMQKEYDDLSAAERDNASVGGALLDRIKDLDTSLKSLEAATGRNQRNVGNYSDSIIDAASKMGSLGKGTQAVVNPMKNANNAMKAMAANPWMAIISLAVTVVLKLTDAFKKNGAAMESLNKVFGIFSGIGTIVDKLIDKIANGVGRLADGLISLGQRLGIINDEMQKGINLAQEQLSLAEASRKVRMEEATTAAEIAELRERASDKENYSLQERIDALNKAQEKENEIAQQRIANARREYELAKQVADQANSSQEELDKVADAYVKWQNEIANTANANRALNKQINSMSAEAQREADARAKEQAQKAKAAREARLKAAQDAARAELDIERQLLLERINAIEDEQDREIALALFSGQKEIDALTIRLQTEKNLTEKAKEDLRALIELKQTELNDSIAAINQKYYDAEVEAERIKNEAILAEEQKLADERKALQDREEEEAKEWKKKFVEKRDEAFQRSFDLYESLGAVADAFTKDEKKRASLQKKFALGSIAIKEAEIIATTAAAISTAVKGATQSAEATGPAAAFTAPVFIAEMVSLVVGALAGTAANIAQAKSIVSGGAFAEGGIVGGTSYTGDRVISRTNSGEMVLTKSQQAQLFSIANGQQTAGFNYDAMASMMREAFASAPAPVMDYREFTTFQQNVARYKEISRL